MLSSLRFTLTHSLTHAFINSPTNSLAREGPTQHAQGVRQTALPVAPHLRASAMRVMANQAQVPPSPADFAVQEHMLYRAVLAPRAQ
jgi:hypothetical protein